jgi:hypothetical protein
MQTNMQHVEPWRMVSYIVVSMIVGWVILMVFTFLEIFLGEQAFLTAPHWSRPPMTRASKAPHETGTPYGFPEPAGERPWLPEQLMWHEEKRGTDVTLIARAAGYPGIVPDGMRRLSAVSSATSVAASTASLHEFFAALPPEVSNAANAMLQRAPTKADATALSAVLAARDSLVAKDVKGSHVSTGWPVPVAESISWPSFFEPKFLACGQHDDLLGDAQQVTNNWVAAISRRGFGAMATLSGGVDDGVNSAGSFRFAGVSHLPPLAGASWMGSHLGRDKEGLMLVTIAGGIVACPGHPPRAGGSWTCGRLKQAPDALPGLAGTSVHAAAMGWLRGAGGIGGEPRLHVALVSQHAPGLVALYSLGDTGTWLPLGEVPVPTTSGRHSHVSLAFTATGELLVGTADGAFVRRRLADGIVLQAGPHGLPSARTTEWQAACASQQIVAHLVLRGSSLGPSSPLAAWRPEVHTTRLSDALVAGAVRNGLVFE